jgi:hypothetical protein
VITKPRYSQRIQPALTFQEYKEFLVRYFDCCLRLNPDGEWAHTRYEAGWDLASWFGALWQNQDIPRQSLQEVKNWLASVYRQGDTELKRCIVDATLEHLFESREIARFFSDWKKSPDLATAYAEATEWVKGKKQLDKESR